VRAVSDADFEVLVADAEAVAAADKKFDEEGIGDDGQAVGRVHHGVTADATDASDASNASDEDETDDDADDDE
jgi:hypothetical protein